MIKSKIIICSGYFNPLTVGHLKMFTAAKTGGGLLFVIVNNDKQVQMKRSIPFMPEAERLAIVSALKPVDAAILSVDINRSVCRTLHKIHDEYGQDFELIFANGGDVVAATCREKDTCELLGIKIIDGVGGTKKVQSSSTLIENAARAYALRQVLAAR